MLTLQGTEEVPISNRKRKITIAGAGLVGSLLAVLLGRRGYAVDLLERRPDMRGIDVDSGRSINLALSSRGVAALELAGLLEEVQALLIPMHGRMLHLDDGRQQLMPYGQRSFEVIYSVSRRDLNCLMMTAAEQTESVHLKFNQKLESIDFQNAKLVGRDLESDVPFERSFDLLIGADGAGSRVRRAMMPVVDGQSDSEFLDHDYKELEIPAGRGDSNFQIHREALHVWPRGDFMLIALPNQDGSFTVTLFLPKTGPQSFESLTDAKRLQEFFKKYFPDALSLIPELEADFFANPQGRLGTVRCRPWYHRDNVLILGDASHAIVPFHGQGMNAGFEDCSELVRLLDRYDDDWTKVLPQFDQIRRPNANAIAQMALENYVTMRDSVTDSKFQLKKEVGFYLENQFPDRFIPRYSMVMFHLIPYEDAWSRGRTQQEILDTLVESADSISQVDLEKAKQLVLERLTPLDLKASAGLSSLASMK